MKKRFRKRACLGLMVFSMLSATASFAQAPAGQHGGGHQPTPPTPPAQPTRPDPGNGDGGRGGPGRPGRPGDNDNQTGAEISGAIDLTVLAITGIVDLFNHIALTKQTGVDWFPSADSQVYCFPINKYDKPIKGKTSVPDAQCTAAKGPIPIAYQMVADADGSGSSSCYEIYTVDGSQLNNGEPVDSSYCGVADSAPTPAPAPVSLTLVTPPAGTALPACTTNITTPDCSQTPPTYSGLIIQSGQGAGMQLCNGASLDEVQACFTAAAAGNCSTVNALTATPAACSGS